MASRYRYLVAKLHDKSDALWSEQEKCGTGTDANCFLYYASVANVIRFGLSQPQFGPGQYNIYLWPEGRSEPVGKAHRAYKKV